MSVRYGESVVTLREQPFTKSNIPLMKTIVWILFFLSLWGEGIAQTIPSNRSVDWTLAGVRDTTTNGFHWIKMQDYNVIGDSVTPNDSAMTAALAAVAPPGAIIEFPAGNFVFNQPILLPDNAVLKGQGATNTTLVFELGNGRHAIQIVGQRLTTDTTSLTQTAAKGSTTISVINPNLFSVGQWVQLTQNDSDWVTSTWAYQTVGQIAEITNISESIITLNSPLRMTYDFNRTPFIQKVIPRKNVGIACLKIFRRADSVLQQASNIFFSGAVNSWVNAVESDRCIFSHVEARYSSNIQVNRSYLHHAQEYGGGGRAYGAMIHLTSNECRIEDNIFQHLRHSMILQAGSNGNVFAYNYSFDPYWSTLPNDAAGDMVLHGNYPYVNLFEQNIAQNMVIDNSHGPNGPFNTYFRNRGGLFGIFFSANNSPDQNLVGNEIPNTSFPYNIVNYTILGTGHLVHGNNNKGTIDPAGTGNLPDSTYAYTQRPAFVPVNEWAKIGTPNVMGSGSIPAKDRWDSGDIFGGACVVPTVGVISIEKETEDEITIFPNPVKEHLTVKSEFLIEKVEVQDLNGKLVKSIAVNAFSATISTHEFPKGMYLLLLRNKEGKVYSTKIVKE